MFSIFFLFLIFPPIFTQKICLADQECGPNQICRLNLRLGFGICQSGSRPVRLTQCLSEDCVRIAARYLTNMDRNVRPCDDFYGFVCGKYGDYHNIPEDKNRFETLGEMKMRQNSIIKKLLDQEESGRNQGLKLAKTYLKSCQEFTKNGTDLDLVRDELSELLGSLDLSQDSWEALEAQISVYGIHPLVEVYVFTDMSNTENMILQFSPAGHFKDPYDFKTRIFEISKIFPEHLNITESEIQEICDFLDRIVNVTSVNQEFKETFNKLPYGELKNRYKNIDFNFFFLGENQLKINNSMIINIEDPKFFENFNNFIKEIPKEVIHNYQVFWFLETFWSHFGSIETLDCYKETRETFKMILAAEFARKHLPKKYKDEVQKMVVDLKSEMKSLISSAKWLDDSTQKAALKKLEKITTFLGYPDFLLNETLILEPYLKLKLDPEDYLKNLINYRLSQRSYSFSENQLKLKGVEGTLDWQHVILESDAFNYYLGNAIIFPAGFIQFPFFLPNSPSFINYGSMGFGIGHEITHAFDSEGAKADGSGKLENWWGNETYDKFNERTACFQEQYENAIKKLVGNIEYDGNITIGEDIADNGGVRIAFEAYKKHLRNEKRKTGIRNVLPGLTEFTDEQMFFIAFGNSICETYNPSKLSKIINNDSDPHSLSQLRLNIPLQNYPEFSRVWGCSADKSQEKTCRIW